MAGRFPFGQTPPGQNALRDAQLRAALGLSQSDEQLLFVQRQQQQELRDYQLRQLLLQGQIDQQSRLDSLLHEQRLQQLREQLGDRPDLQHHYMNLLMRDRQSQLSRLEEQALRERAQLQRAQLENRVRSDSITQAQLPSALSMAGVTSPGQHLPLTFAAGQPQNKILRDIAAESLAGNSVKRSELEKRAYAPPDETTPNSKKREGLGYGDGDGRKKKARRNSIKGTGDEDSGSDEYDEGRLDYSLQSTANAEDLLDFAVSAAQPGYKQQMRIPTAVRRSESVVSTPTRWQETAPLKSLGSLDDLLIAAETDQKSDEVVTALAEMKEKERDSHWSDSESEPDNSIDNEEERLRAVEKGETIQLPGFSSILPQLPVEPELEISPKKIKRRDNMSILDDDYEEKPIRTTAKVDHRTEDATEVLDLNNVEYPYPIDTWWPSVTSVRRERKSNGEPQDEDSFEEDPELIDADSQFRIPIDRIQERFETNVQPGVLEKIPHCRIHRMLMKKRKNPSAPDLVYCFQVTELYPNDPMVCCSHCGIWRHSTCGGHYKSYSIRECIEKPFATVCDRCHEEEKVLQNDALARKRLDRQRCEQIRRGLATSAAMRQASFSKHGGTYKWPLGSVSATHIGGHTRSVHTRHDKAEKQWGDMSSRLGRGYGYRPKERAKVRTKELERLLVSVEDAEGHTDRHNMLAFLMNDTQKEHPTGFEHEHRNIFDPREDDSDVESDSPHGTFTTTYADLVNDSTVEGSDNGHTASSVCVRKGCQKRARFDSRFCSDSCGVSTLESDLLRTFQYTSDMHPSALRS